MLPIVIGRRERPTQCLVQSGHACTHRRQIQMARTGEHESTCGFGLTSSCTKQQPAAAAVSRLSNYIAVPHCVSCCYTLGGAVEHWRCGREVSFIVIRSYATPRFAFVAPSRIVLVCEMKSVSSALYFFGADVSSFWSQL